MKRACSLNTNAEESAGWRTGEFSRFASGQAIRQLKNKLYSDEKR
jgi:hypothetical protein